jgi:hypothetical protein
MSGRTEGHSVGVAYPSGEFGRARLTLTRSFTASARTSSAIEYAAEV